MTISRLSLLLILLSITMLLIIITIIVISWYPFWVCSEESVLTNNQQSQFRILPAAYRELPFFFFFLNIHSGDTWSNKGSIYLQDLWGPRDHTSTGPRREWWSEIWPQRPVGPGTWGKLDTKFEIDVFVLLTNSFSDKLQLLFTPFSSLHTEIA